MAKASHHKENIHMYAEVLQSIEEADGNQPVSLHELRHSTEVDNTRQLIWELKYLGLIETYELKVPINTHHRVWTKEELSTGVVITEQGKEQLSIIKAQV